MPHVILQGAVTVADWQRRHAPFVIREANHVFKMDRLYVDTTGRAALLETILVTGSHTQKFFIQLSNREEGLTVRLEPLTDPEKNPGVKRALALVAHRIQAATGCRYGSTNIAEYLMPSEDGVREG